MRSNACHVVVAALGYWAAVFALGFVLGSIRTMWLAPRLGLLPATLIELPIMLAASWLIARQIVRRIALRSPAQALAMGMIAFALLMASELAVGLTVFGVDVTQWAVDLIAPNGLPGFAAQVAFALMPWWIRHNNGIERGR